MKTLTAVAAYDTLTFAEQQEVLGTILGAGITVTGKPTPQAITAAAHAAVDHAVATGDLHPNRAALYRQAITDKVNETLGALVEALR